LSALWRDLNRVFFNIPIHYLYENSTNSKSGFNAFQHDHSKVVLWPVNTKVLTYLGSGVVVKYRATDNIYVVKLTYGIAYVTAETILGAEQLSTQALSVIIYYFQ
jgi:hypothetical protein